MCPLELKRKVNPDDLKGLSCTLDDKPASVCGGKDQFGTIATLDGKQRVIYSWDTVANIMSKDCCFKS